MDTPKVIFNALKTDGGHAFTGEVTFNRVTLNEGNGMRSNGFTAPIAGHIINPFRQMVDLKYMGKIHGYMFSRMVAN